MFYLTKEKMSSTLQKREKLNHLDNNLQYNQRDINFFIIKDFNRVLHLCLPVIHFDKKTHKCNNKLGVWRK